MMCLGSKKKPEVGLEAQPPVSMLQIQPLKTKSSTLSRTNRKANRSRIPLSKEKLKSQFEERQKALGAEPNSALIERIYSCKEMTKDLSIKKGDLIFSLEELKKVPKSNDKKKCRKSSKEEIRIRKRETDADNDTLYPKSLSTTETDKEQTEEMQLDEPNSENYMYNEQEILFVCHDMIRQLNKEDINEPSKLSLMESSDALQYDPYAPLEELEKQECFNCHTLRRNTFLANTLSMPNEKERQIKSKPKLPSKVTFNEEVFDLTDWEELASTAEEQSEKTQTGSELELVKTQDILPQTSIEATEKLSGKARSKNLLERSKTMKLEELASQNSVSGTFSKAKMLPSPIHEKETSRNNRELQ